MGNTPRKQASRLHLAIAERGKVKALGGDHLGALALYREALRLACESKDHEVFARHYVECAMESLELMGCLDDVLAYCDAAVQHYKDTPPTVSASRRDLAAIQQRRGVILLKLERRADAVDALRAALELDNLPLTRQLLSWLERGMTITPVRITEEQHRLGYFSVRPETVRPSWAAKAPPESFDSCGPGAAFSRR